MTDRELMQQALDALESVFEGDDKGAEYWTVTGGTYEAVECMNAMRALRARLAQPEPEPVTMVISKTGDPSVTMSWWHEPALPVGTPLYTAPPQREWQGLTDEEREEATGWSVEHIEAKLKQKNA